MYGCAAGEQVFALDSGVSLTQRGGTKISLSHTCMHLFMQVCTRTHTHTPFKKATTTQHGSYRGIPNEHEMQ